MGLQSMARGPNPVCNGIFSTVKKHISGKFVDLENVTYPEIIILGEMSGPRTVV